MKQGGGGAGAPKPPAEARNIKKPANSARPRKLPRTKSHRGKHSGITVKSASQNNLTGFDLRIGFETLTVISGVSGSGKSSLAFDTLYSEGQRRYTETFSAYVRQFLERLPRPEAASIHDIPAGVAIQPSGAVKGSRSTVGTLTSINDYLKLIFARFSDSWCPNCGVPVTPQTSKDVVAYLKELSGLALITAPVRLGSFDSPGIVANALKGQGFTRFMRKGEVLRLEELEKGDVSREELPVVVDRLSPSGFSEARALESIETAFRIGDGSLEVLSETGEKRPFTRKPVCNRCGHTFKEPSPGLFSFNSPLGACPECRGFGRVADIDPARCVPDPSLSIDEGAIKPFTTARGRNWRRRLLRFCRSQGIPPDVPYRDLPPETKRMIMDGGPGFGGVRGFFSRLERKKYKTHVRVFIARYRGYEVCPACKGRRLCPAALDWRVKGLTLPEMCEMPVDRLREVLGSLEESPDQTTGFLSGEVSTRLGYLSDVGLEYLTLSRQSRTLSAGELERVNLTSALGTGLVGALFVLDEPTVGLHPRDGERLLGVISRIRDQGNTVVVVEHDPLILKSADRVVDLGPGSGRDGGRIVAQGTAKQLARAQQSRTGAFLSGREKVRVPRRRSIEGRRWITVEEATCHNLKGITCRFPLGVFTCVTGPSGSGKSTLLEDVLWRTFMAERGKPAGRPGDCRALRGLERVNEVVLVDQEPPAKTSRATVASYLGILDPVRKAFANTRQARERSYTPGYFSFNSSYGQCPACRGQGFERVEMQFLPDAYIPCEECEGKRYKGKVLEVRYGGHNIAELLELTCEETAELFDGNRQVQQVMAVVKELGLGYLKMGQPLTALSGGELQRLKLLRHILKSEWNGILFVLDEPSIGLHLADIASLVRLLNHIVDTGNTVCVIEHNMEIAKCADYCIDLGPGGGEQGGEIVAAGTPEQVAGCKHSVTAPFLREAISGKALTSGIKESPKNPVSRDGAIKIRGARDHNLKDIDVEIPRDRLVVVTGLSGAGKSTLLYDVVFSEGQRRYLDCLSPYARQFAENLPRPNVDHIEGIPPTVAIEQRSSAGAARSTVGTVTEIYPFLRLLFARVGVQYCPDCGLPVKARGEDSIYSEVRRRARSGGFLLCPRVRGRRGYHTGEFERALREGFEWARVDGKILEIEPKMRLSRYRPHDIDFVSYKFGDIPRDLRKRVSRALDLGSGTVIFLDQLGGEVILSRERACPGCRRGFEVPEPRNFSFLSRWGRCPFCEGKGEIDGKVCEECGGVRISLPWREVRVGSLVLGDIVNAEIELLGGMLSGLDIPERQRSVSEPVLHEVSERVAFLRKVGLGYLTLNRAVPSLSTGEARRIRLASQLGSNLHGVCYLLDEPTIGLHARDNRRLLEALRALRDRGNTVVVVEHDDSTVLSADHIIELGPGPGKSGGEVVVCGEPEAVRGEPRSATGRYLSKGKRELTGTPPGKSSGELLLRGARAHNLKGVDVKLPLGSLVCVTGVSGAGKSSLVKDSVLYGLQQYLRTGRKKGPFEALEGAAEIERVADVDQSPIGRTPRSVPATYIGLWSAVRSAFANVAEARLRGFTERHFSFNSPEGACRSCKGQGRIKLQMNFLPDVFIQCELCRGMRFRPEVLLVTLGGKNIGEVLQMEVEEAVSFFASYPRISRPLQFLRDIGLGYLELGQPSTTLSGGEAQRIKLARELASRGRGRGFFVLDEPTTGLHMEDVARLMAMLRRLRDQGHLVCVIEHNLEVISGSDYIIDLGPDGGSDGGEVVYQGSVEGILRHKRKSYTARYLESFLKGKR